VIETPRLSVITPIDLDHQQFLGETLEEIAGEKAGIIKRGVPCIVGRQKDAALEVIERQAARLGAPLFRYGQEWHVSEERGRLVYQDDNGLLDLPHPALLGPHQIENAGTAIAALRQMGCDEAAFDGAMTGATWPARMQRLRSGPLVEIAGNAELWLDGGHNPAAGKALAATLQGLPARPTYFITGMLKTKDVSGYMAELANVSDTLFAVSIPGEAATLSAQETADYAAAAGFEAKVSEHVADALSAILQIDPAARVVISGSLYLAGAILRENG
jgi:dihydrofolate synthase/folylpolyglutamate synthase